MKIHFLAQALLLVASGLSLSTQVASAAITIHTVGDSTVALWAARSYPKIGWGQDLHFFFDPRKVVIHDQGISGSSSKSYFENNWPAVKATIVPGDFVTIQFGINDGAKDVARHTDSFTTFEDFLTKFCDETTALGAHPILVTTVNRNSWKNGILYPAYHDYPIATRELAARLGVPLIDLDRMEGELRTSLGETYSLNYLSMIFPAGDWPNYPNGSSDSVHFQESGAIELDNLVVQGIKALNSHPMIAPLISALVPTHTVDIQAINPAMGLVTRTQSVPPGVTFTLLAIPGPGHTFAGWTGGVNSWTAITQFEMGTTDMSIVGHFR